MKRAIYILTILVIILFGKYCYASTYYISPTGNDTTGNGSNANPWATISKACSSMTGGDTLICKDGTYTGENNRISADQHPPYGTSANWTVIKAENDGAAIFDGQNARTMIDMQNGGANINLYYQFEGLILCRSAASNISFSHYNYVKFLRCGAYDAGGGCMNFDVGRQVSYFLFENCYAWGTGRYKFMAYQSDHIIFRSCVARMDSNNCEGEPLAVFSIYSVDYCKVQNCIAIDSDQTAAWSNVLQYAGGFAVPSTDMNSNYVDFENCIALNVKLGGFCVTGNEYYRAGDTTFTNCVEWDCKEPGNYTPNILRGLRTVINKCTLGKVSGLLEEYLWSYDSGSSGSTTLKNSILYSITGSSVLYDVETQDYNAYYANTNNNNSGSHDKTAINPIWNAATNPNGALKYLTRIETGSTLSGQGESGSDIGANIKTLIGASGTIYGEAGYDTDTGISMWPFPNEDLIRTKMRAYTHTSPNISGARGFCADGETLTHYIMNYLGNGDPYSGLQITTVNLPNGVLNSSYSQVLQAAGGLLPYTWTLNSGSLPEGLVLNSSSGIIAGIPLQKNTYTFSIKLVDNLAAEVEQALSITITDTVDTSVTNDGNSGGGGGCFIATIVYGNSEAEEVKILKRFRDDVLLTNVIGKVVVKSYYTVGPHIAKYLSRRPHSKHLFLNILNPFVWIVKHSLK